ncbi:hypothetical protein GLOTRDRAFT_135438 [Gloeophyllum trabeum ATCC 11539]|uniref:GYF domain-containing protein n=1 Tax=Gloeophyllum trabeum (strain ATCC 11539 / FP-39264 / Madison 617) TaxID=670483 RepID=S7QMV7_GLOTA|nr:uncharacterized protein GLOTRDRAFT_135438 [Gloeophyllum trabeum ATCC 11539]EPQ60823.1 hypothetical protein GLOTRDRAFT_135438 [Gloeophyllum trabeum ATCC 11539]
MSQLGPSSSQTSFLDPHTYTHGDSVPGLSADDNDDQWSVRDTVNTDDQSMVAVARRRQMQELAGQSQDDLTVRGPKISGEPKDAAAPVVNSNIEATTPTSTGPEAASDAASTRSLPLVQVTSPQSPTRPSTAHASNSTFPNGPADPMLSPSPSPNSQRPSTAQERRNRHRSTVDTRASNRISGFFSNLMHRRDPMASSSIRQGTQEEAEPSPTPTRQKSETNTRSSSPVRPSTPPPSLPPPSLQELGLSLSSITSILSPSHFTTPPSSGAFLAPHYLLLCHAQGLDVVPLVAPPAPQPYALVRRVSFKSVVVMEHRGVLVAIAGRRDGVRVYALEEVKKAVEWRIEVEVRREAERKRREDSKRNPPSSSGKDSDKRALTDKHSKSKLSISSSGAPAPPEKPPRKASSASASSAPVPSQASSARSQLKKRKSSPQVKPLTQVAPPVPPGPPPSYSSSVVDRTRRESATPVPLDQARARRSSVTDVLSGPLDRRNASTETRREELDLKGDWSDPRHSSDDEAINLVSAGASGSEAYDERTSAMAAGAAPPVPASTSGNGLARVDIPPLPPAPGRALSTQMLTATTQRRSRPSNLDLTSMRAHTSAGIPPPHPSPTPTLMSLRQALTVSASSNAAAASDGEPPDSAAMTEDMSEPASPTGDGEGNGDGGEDETPREEISLAEALLESRIPDLPPAGSRRPQQPILITASHPIATGDDEPASPRTSEAHSTRSTINTQEQRRRRRRWSVLDLVPGGSPTSSQAPPVPETEVPATATSSAATVPVADRRRSRLVRSQSFRSQGNAASASNSARPSSSPGNSVRAASLPTTAEDASAQSSSTNRPSSRFISRLIQDVLHPRRDDASQVVAVRGADQDGRKMANGHSAPHAPAPKLEYVKLPGTKGALLIKAVETAKKSFLAILCGDNGEKVELFAGTYRTALGLSRTFILPDSPRSLELQLQGDDLVEVFLVFSQNVFGLEPATVRVREVRIGRAERRAARRRARETRPEEAATADADAAPAAEEDTNVNVSIGVPVPASGIAVASDTPGSTAPSAANSPFGLPPPPEDSQTPAETSNPTTSTSTEELVALATAHMGPYTTFQQLSFSPNFPLAAIADEYMIPPTYPSFLQYRAEHEPEVNGSATVDLAQVNFSPPGLPVPAPTAPSMWYYRDPKGVVHGPWKASLMQAWYKDGLLPPDLPVRREEDAEFILLRDLRLQSVDPTHPFRPTPPPMNVQAMPLVHEPSKPLLPPISLLAQPKHFGPPALFYSSRGGHSTAIVDARGRSVLKARFVWSQDDDDDTSSVTGRMGDVKRLEAFDVKDRAVLVAMRQGGLEAVDFGDALLKPADESRTVLPQFNPSLSVINRRAPFVWKIGTPISPTGSPSSLSAAASSKAGQRMKKGSTGPGKSPGRTDFSFGPDPAQDNQLQEEVLFLGRKDDEIYLCERRTGSFRILRLSPTGA